MNENYAIVVGLNCYPGVTTLNGPENDATWFHDWLVNNKLVDANNATLILSPAGPGPALAIDAKPDTVTVDQAFERLLQKGVTLSTVGKTLYLFFAGHGFGPTLNDAALLMANCDFATGVTGHYINAIRYADFFATAAFFDEIVLFMDCCRDDLWRAPDRLPPWQPLSNPAGGSVKRFYALATKWARKAREMAVSPGGPVHGNFTWALKAALEGGAASGNGDLATSAVLDFTTNYIQTVIKDQLAPQHVEVPEPQFVQRDDFVMASGLTPALTDVTIRFQAGSQLIKRNFWLVGGRSNIQKRNINGDDPWNHALEFGQYTLVAPNGTMAAKFNAFGTKVVLDV